MAAGRRDEACTPSRRQCSCTGHWQRPARGYRDRLASSLGTLAEALQHAGRAPEAWQGTSESVGIYDGMRLAGPDAHDAAG
jgi:hypothetical protein